MKNNSHLRHSFPGGNDALDDESVDIYLFNIGNGRDIIDDAACVDILRIGSGVLPDDIAFARNGMDVVLRINGTDDQLTLQNWGRSRNARIKCIEFADGTVWHTAYLQLQIAAANTGMAGDDSQTV
ncbi:MAG: hypothetical protein A2Z95_04070 [Gallionellales bacterium GWA2_60_18]|nr:MAG: hypothetical protein A2Z95_04070 [Gallionellales bacterium GWA2_60_18]